MKKTLPLTSPQSKTSDPPRTTEDNHPAPSSLVASKASAVRAAESEVTWVAVVSKRNPTKRELDFEAAVYEPQRSSSRPARTTSKATSKEVAFPPPRPKERGHGTRQARGNPAQPKKKRRRGRRGQGPQRQEKREARRNRRESEGARGNTKLQLYCLQKDCHAMKKQLSELAAAVAALKVAISSVVDILPPIKTLVSTLPAIQIQVQQLSLKLLCRCEGQAAYITGEGDYLCSICNKDHKQCYLCASNCEVGCSKKQTTWNSR